MLRQHALLRASRALTGVILLVALAAPGCGRDARPRLVVYSPHGKEMLVAFEKAYEAAHPGTDVVWLDLGSQDIYDRVRTERSNPQADVWWGAPASVFARAEAESLLERFEPSWASAVPPDRRSAAGFWWGTFLTPEVIMVNERTVPPEARPRDWDDLLDRQWRGRILIRHPLSSGTMRTIFSALIARETDRTGSEDSAFAWLRRLDANTKAYVADPTQLYLRIAREEGAVTLWNLPDVIMQRRINSYPFAYVLPSSGTPLVTDGIAVVRGTRAREEAVRFCEFVTSVESMVSQAEQFGRIPARTDIPAERLPAWVRDLSLEPMALDWERLLASEQRWMKRWDEEVKGKGKDTDERP
jgi:iron(III) transport system substrate-binding protein